MLKILRTKKKASVIENVLVCLIMIVMTCAFLVIVFGAFSSINDKWTMRQAARETLLIMETEGYLKPADKQNLLNELSDCGLYNISLSGTTESEVGYGNRIYLNITGTYDDNILAFAGGISKVAKHPTTVTIKRQSTAKQ